MKYLLVLLLLSNVAFAQSTPKAPASPATTTQATASTTLMSEKDYYKMMYEQAAASATSANTLTQWTLASVAGVIVLVIGGQIFFNYRLGEREIAAIRSDVQVQIAEAGSAQLRTLSEISTANQLAMETRTQAIEHQLRVAINRELDTSKDALNTLLTIQIQAITLVKAEIALLKKSPEEALLFYLDLAKSKLTDLEFDFSIFHGITNSLRQVKELERLVFEELKNLIPIANKHFGWGGYYLGKLLNSVGVYELVDDAANPNVNSGVSAKTKRWIQNEPTHSGNPSPDTSATI